MHMKLRSNMNVTSAEIVSRIRTRLNATKTRFMFVAIRGPAPRSLATTVLSMNLPTDPVRPIHAVIAETNFSGQVVVQEVARSTVEMRRDMLRIRTGKNASNIYRKCTSFESATHPRSSSGQTTSDNT